MTGFLNDRLKLLNSFKHPETIEAIALQPGTNGNLFATGCEDGIVRLFDTRRNKTGNLRRLSF